MRAFFHKWLDNDTRLTAIFAAVSAVALAFSLSGVLKNLLPFDIAWIAIILCGIPILVGAFCRLFFEHDIKADVLVAMALVASLFTKQFFAAGEVSLIMQIGLLLEDYTSGKAEAGIEKLIGLTPQMARILRDGKEVQVRAEDVKIDDVIKVLAGETIPVDGVILEDETSINQSVMTGESVSVDKTSGDKVLSGTLKSNGVFTMRAKKASADSSLQRMVRLAKEAEENKAPVVKLADKWATWLVLVALLCAVGTWIFTNDFMRAVTVLVVFCPCAFILATPTAVLAGIGNAVVKSYEEKFGGNLPEASNVKVIKGKGISAEVLGKEVLCGKESWIKEKCHPELVSGSVGNEMLKQVQHDNSFHESSATQIFVAIAGKLAGVISLSDTLREDAPRTIAKLKSAVVNPVLLAGDNEAADAVLVSDDIAEI